MGRFPVNAARRPSEEERHARAHRPRGLDRPAPSLSKGRGPPRRRRVNEKRALNRVRQKSLIV